MLDPEQRACNTAQARDEQRRWRQPNSREEPASVLSNGSPIATIKRRRGQFPLALVIDERFSFAAPSPSLSSLRR